MLLSLVCDGWSGKPSPLVHQLLLLPALCALGLLLFWLFRPVLPSVARSAKAGRTPRWVWGVLALFEAASIGFFRLEDSHFRRFGYHIATASWIAFGSVLLLVGVSFLLWRGRGPASVVALFGCYAVGVLLAVHSFPLNYLRSDMLPVIQWADGRLLAHGNPYATMRVGGRIYDFPYLPGMLVAYLPAVATRVDVRWANLLYLLGATLIIVAMTKAERRGEASTLLGLFLLSPFLQYRHDLYLEPHWFTLVVAVALMQRRRFGWAGFWWGVSCGIYQLSWVIVPFALLHTLRQEGWRAAMRVLLCTATGALLIVGPFLRAATHQVAHNTVGQWRHLSHALADPINLSYWATFLVRPDQLMWLQAVVLVFLFAWCVVRHRCRDLEDTLRWMIWALALFISLNVLVDGYFYLTLLLLVLLYVCVASGCWKQQTATTVPFYKA